jgi:hypothetical protein
MIQEVIIVSDPIKLEDIKGTLITVRLLDTQTMYSGLMYPATVLKELAESHEYMFFNEDEGVLYMNIDISDALCDELLEDNPEE